MATPQGKRFARRESSEAEIVAETARFLRHQAMRLPTDSRWIKAFVMSAAILMAGIESGP